MTQFSHLLGVVFGIEVAQKSNKTSKWRVWVNAPNKLKQGNIDVKCLWKVKEQYQSFSLLLRKKKTLDFAHLKYFFFSGQQKKEISNRIRLVHPYWVHNNLVFFHEKFLLTFSLTVSKKNLRSPSQRSCREKIMNPFLFVFFSFLQAEHFFKNSFFLFAWGKKLTTNASEWLIYEKERKKKFVFLNVVFLFLEDSLGTRVIYLHDDAKFRLASSVNRQASDIYIKILRTIAQDQSWYETIGKN